MEILVDTSIWIDYFRGGKSTDIMDYLIDENLITTNDIILAELVPYLRIRNQNKVIELLHCIKKLPLNIHWDEIIDDQVTCLKSGANGIGIPDLVIAQNAKQHQCFILSLDKHFNLMSNLLQLKLYQL